MRLKKCINSSLFIAGTAILLTSCASPTNSSNLSDIASSIPSPIMPDVICMDLQSAQDLIQDQGIFFSKSEDASGQGRRQIIDTNWVVVSQNIEVGAPINEGEVILAVLKEDEIDQSTSCSEN